MVFTPTFLYIKQHKITGLLYFGKHSGKDPIKYKGSGKHWVSHYKKHGKEHIDTLWYCLFLDQDSLTNFALNFSQQENIVESNEWANLKFENGLDGGNIGYICSEETKKKMSLSSKGRKTMLGKSQSDETKKKISMSRTGQKGTSSPKPKEYWEQFRYMFSEIIFTKKKRFVKGTMENLGKKYNLHPVTIRRIARRLNII